MPPAWLGAVTPSWCWLAGAIPSAAVSFPSRTQPETAPGDLEESEGLGESGGKERSRRSNVNRTPNPTSATPPAMASHHLGSRHHAGRVWLGVDVDPKDSIRKNPYCVDGNGQSQSFEK